MNNVTNNKNGKVIENPATGKPLTSVTDQNGKYSIIYGFNGITAGDTLSITPKAEDGKPTSIAIDTANPTTQQITIESSKTEDPSWFKKNWKIIAISGGSLVALIVTIVVVKKLRKK